MTFTSPFVWLLFLALALVIGMAWVKWTGRQRHLDAGESLRPSTLSKNTPVDMAEDDAPYVDAPQNNPIRPLPLVIRHTESQGPMTKDQGLLNVPSRTRGS